MHETEKTRISPLLDKIIVIIIIVRLISYSLECNNKLQVRALIIAVILQVLFKFQTQRREAWFRPTEADGS
jgi:hypothetical protein